MKRIEKAEKPKPSLIAIWYGSFDAWVENQVLPDFESGALDGDFIDIVAALRRWETEGVWQRT